MSSEELNIYDAGLLLVKKAVQNGADEAEAYLVKSRNYIIRANNNRIVGTMYTEEYGIGLRVSIGNKIGYASTNRFAIKSINELVENALSIARAGKDDPYWHGLPLPSEYKVPQGIYSIDLARIDEETLSEHTRVFLDTLLEDERIVLVYGDIGVSINSTAVVNSNGVAGIEHSTIAFADVGVVASSGSDVTPLVYDVVASRIQMPNMEFFARQLRDTAIAQLKPIKIEPGKLPVILHPLAIEELFTYTLVDAIKGDSVVRGRSFLAGKEGEKVFSEKLSIIDDGLLKQGWYTGIFDDEGVPMQKTIIINRGVVKNYLFDHYWGSRYGLDSTGNASRISYRTTPVITPTNLVIKPGDIANHEILEETKKGLYVMGLQGAHSSNPETGEYSVVVTPAWYVENGELKPIRGVMISGNIYSELARLEYVGKEVIQKGHIIAPYIRLEDIRVVSK